MKFRDIPDEKFEEMETELQSRNIERNWEFPRDGLLVALEYVCGQDKIPSHSMVTRWWNDTVDRPIREKSDAWKAWTNVICCRREVKRQVYVAKMEVEKENLAYVQ